MDIIKEITRLLLQGNLTKEEADLMLSDLNNDNLISSEDVKRVEVIDENGRSYVNWKSSNKVQLSLQDNGKTLKIFISEK